MYREVFTYFFHLGCLGFGGPLAVISTIQDDLIEKRKWMDREDFNAVFALIKAMPGPVAFQTAVYMGRHRAGFWGGALAAFGLVFPAFFLMILFSLFFKSINHLTYTSSIMLGMQVSALGVILGSLKNLIKNYAKDFFFWILIIISGAINFLNPSSEALIILLFGIMIIIFRKYQRRSLNIKISLVAPLFFLSNSLRDLFFVCFKAGALVFGTGLAIVPMLQHDVVVKYKWLTQSEFLNALAFGQMTPGPVVISATYIGHKIAGMPGAIVATLAIFSAAFFHMSTWFPLVVKYLRGKAWIPDFVFGAVAAVVGPIIISVIKMSLDIHFNYFLIIMAVIVFILTLINKIPLWILIPLGGILNMFFSYL